MRRPERESDSGWIGAAWNDDLDARLAAEVDEFAAEQPRIETLLGPIAPAALGSTLFGERFLSDEPSDAGFTHAAFNRERLLAELDDVATSGTRAIVAVDRRGRDGDVEFLRWLAGRAVVHVVVATSTGDFAPEDGAAAARAMDDALAVGLGGTASKAGAIAVALDSGSDAPSADGTRVEPGTPTTSYSRSLFDAVADVHRSTAAPVLIRARNLDVARGGAAQLANRGIPLDRIALVGCAHGADVTAMRSALERGVTLAFDQILAFGWAEAARQAGAIAALVAAGYGDRIVLATGLTAPTGLRAFGGEPGWAALADRVPLALLDHGLAATDVRRLLVDNPARLLTIDPGRQG